MADDELKYGEWLVDYVEVDGKEEVYLKMSIMGDNGVESFEAIDLGQALIGVAEEIGVT